MYVYNLPNANICRYITADLPKCRYLLVKLVFSFTLYASSIIHLQPPTVYLYNNKSRYIYNIYSLGHIGKYICEIPTWPTPHEQLESTFMYNILYNYRSHHISSQYIKHSDALKWVACI